MTTDERMVAFGKRVREVRKAKGISQEKLAEMAGIDRSYMGNIERGEKNITLKKIYEICDALEIDIKLLI
ncbi:helix-turn-helix domain-containing protein [Psychrobacter sp. DAB_AL32B]|uniref:helix-turn-helix domain-containing protein n=1 Tax=Psychrobacter sp. DAB_AL32B TaxID=1028414 RepID=UPI000B7F0B59|nr:helix-turn-helix transcriptional regulator [Psychrobacter sp. DAB_AL32B]AZB74556.1 Orf [Cloning vector pPS-BR]AZB74559.1 Orf [Cloning vector pPS-NR]OXL18942.1 transcriptional regulator [Psychrobacter sp. DAB_AL32B]QBQ68715.1 XRE-family like protein [Psychrobacter sp. DAB_AL32B]